MLSEETKNKIKKMEGEIDKKNKLLQNKDITKKEKDNIKKEINNILVSIKDVIEEEKKKVEDEKKQVEEKLNSKTITVEVEKIVETQVYPEDYHQIKNELEVFKKLKQNENVEKANVQIVEIISNEEFVQNYNFDAQDFESAIKKCSVLLNPYIYMDNIYIKMDNKHKKYLLQTVSNLESELYNLKNQIIFCGGMKNE
jgi:hypothetical protein